MKEEFLTRQDLAIRWALHVQTLTKWRTLRRGPPLPYDFGFDPKRKPGVDVIHVPECAGNVVFQGCFKLESQVTGRIG